MVIPMASVEQTAVGEGQIGPYYEDIARSLKEDNFDGVISLESVYHPGNGSFEDGFHASIERFKAIFG